MNNYNPFCVEHNVYHGEQSRMLPCVAKGAVIHDKMLAAHAEHEPVARGGEGGLWNVEGGSLVGRRRIRDAMNYWVADAATDDRAEQIVTEHNSYHSLLAERERLREALKRRTHKMKRRLLTLALMTTALIVLTASGPVAQCSGSGCARWLRDCEGVASSAYEMCVKTGQSPQCCLNDYVWHYNTCAAGTGCPFTPFSTENRCF